MKSRNKMTKEEFRATVQCILEHDRREEGPIKLFKLSQWKRSLIYLSTAYVFRWDETEQDWILCNIVQY